MRKSQLNHYRRINWEEVERHLGISERGEPESILHEIAHVLDAVGGRAFYWCGNQSEVFSTIEEVFETEDELEAAEVRATAITILTLRALQSEVDPLPGCLKLMIMNLPEGDFEQRKATLGRHMASPEVQTKVQKILEYLTGFELDFP